jgi:hypothetical protein
MSVPSVLEVKVCIGRLLEYMHDNGHGPKGNLHDTILYKHQNCQACIDTAKAYDLLWRL